MGIAEDVAERLAKDVIRQMEETGDEDLAREVTKVLAQTSVPTEEAFNAAMRSYTADKLARKVLVARAGLDHSSNE